MPKRDPRTRPESLFALAHFAWLVVEQCERLWQALEAQEDVSHLPELSRERQDAVHRVLGERFFLLTAAREMVRAIDRLRMGRLPGSMHDELKHFRDALTHWDEWGTPKSRAERAIRATYPDEWPYQLEVKDGEVLLGGSLTISSLGAAAQQLHEWTQDPRRDHGLVIPPDPHSHRVFVRVTKDRFLPVARLLDQKGFKCAGGNTSLWVWLLEPTAIEAVSELVTSVDPNATIGSVEENLEEEDE